MQNAQTDEQTEHGVPEHVLSWWIALLEGEAEGSHPLFGNALQARLEEQTLVVSGALPSEAGRRDLDRELRQLAEHRGIAVRNETRVAPDGTEASGLLEQTLVAVYAQELHAKLAIEQVQRNPLLGTVRIRLLQLDGDNATDGGEAAARRHVASSYRDEVRQALEAGQAVVVATADETDTFALRQLLDEETRSLQVLVMPPVVAADPATGAAEEEQP